MENGIKTELVTILTELNEFIHQESKLFEYHMRHINLLKEYAFLINEKLGNPIDNLKLEIIALAHDILKERGLDPEKGTIEWNGHHIPQDTKRYVRTNLDTLEEYGLDDYFNTDVQLHPLSAGLLLINEFDIKDREILFPVMFHSCPAMPIYKTLTDQEKLMVDVVMLADKLSSNYLKINMIQKKVRIDLDRLVFGESGKEFNYSMGLVLARIIGAGKSKEPTSVAARKHYIKLLRDQNPILPEKMTIKDLGDEKIWAERKSQALKME